MITFTDAVKEAAKDDDLAKVLHRMLSTINDKHSALQKMENADDYMGINGKFVSECEANLYAIDCILNQKAREFAQKAGRLKKGEKLCLVS